MLHLYVIDPNDEHDRGLPPSALRPLAYLEKLPNWFPAIEETWLVLDSPKGEALLGLNPFGQLDWLVPQLEEVADRLETGRRAIIRSAGDWTPIFLVLEPDGDLTRLSVLAPVPRPWGAYYPLRHSPFWTPEPVDQLTTLHSYIEEHRDSLRPGPSASRAELELQDVELPTRELVISLREEARAGKELYEFLLSKRK